MVGMDFRNFKEIEFKRASPSCSLSDMDISFMVRLDMARDIAGVPFIVNSAYRSVEYEKQKGRSGTSSHCKGLAVDIRCADSDTRLRILSAALFSGFRRIGVGLHFIHLDDDESKPAGVWLY